MTHSGVQTTPDSSSTDGFTVRPNGNDLAEHFRHYRRRPQHPDFGELLAEAHRLADRIHPDLEPPLSQPRTMRRKIRSWSTLLRNHAENWRRERRGRHDLWPIYFLWTSQRSCNFRCVYCDDHLGSRYPDLPNKGVLDTAQAIRMLTVMRSRTPSVLISGGEPTLRTDLPVVIRAARGLDYYPIILNTNGSLIHELLQNREWRTLPADVDHIVVSLDSLDTEVLSEMYECRRPKQIIVNILLLQELAEAFRFRLMISTVIQPDFIPHARDVLNWCNDLNICFCPMPVNVGPTIERDLLAEPDYLDLVKLILDRKRLGYPVAGSERLNRRMLTARPLDCRNTLKPHVDFDGRLFWPCKASVSVTPLRINTLAFPDLESIYHEGCRHIDPTDFHTRCGAQCNWSQNYTTDAYVHGIRHPATLLREVVGFLRGR